MAIEGTPEVIIPSSEHDRKAMISELQAICDELTMIEGRRAVIKDIIENVAEAFKIPKGVVSKLANMHYKRNKDKLQAETNEVCDAYDQLFNPTGAV